MNKDRKKVPISFEVYKDVWGLGVGLVFNDLYDREYEHKLSIIILCLTIEIVLWRTKKPLKRKTTKI